MIRLIDYTAHNQGCPFSRRQDQPLRVYRVRLLCDQLYWALVEGSEKNIALLADETGGTLKLPQAGLYIEGGSGPYTYVDARLRVVPGPEEVVWSLHQGEQRLVEHLTDFDAKLSYLGRVIDGDKCATLVVA